MRIISRDRLIKFYEGHADSKDQLESWYTETKHAHWSTPVEIKQRYGSADPTIPGNRVVFNIKGNDYRLVVKVNYKAGIVYIRFIGTHADYNKINAEKI